MYVDGQDRPRLDERRERLVRAAEHLFLTIGYDSATVEAMVECARVSKSTFYDHFADRTAIFIEVARRLSHVPQQAAPASPASRTADLATAAMQYRVGHLREPGLGIFRVAIAAHRVAPDLARTLYLARLAEGAPLATTFRSMAEKEPLRIADPMMIVARFGSLAIDGPMHLAGIPLPDENARRASARRLALLFVKGRAGPAARARLAVAAPAWDGRSLPVAAPAESAGGPRRRLSEERWDSLLRIASAEFIAAGYVEASMQTISQRAGMPKNTIYRHYPSKAELFVQSSRLLVSRTFSSVPPMAEGAASLVEALEMLGAHLQRQFCTPDMLELHRILIANVAADPRPSARIYEWLRATVLSLIEPFFALLASEGLIEDDPALAAWDFYVLSTFNIRYLFCLPSPAERAGHISDAVSLFLLGIKAGA